MKVYTFTEKIAGYYRCNNSLDVGREVGTASAPKAMFTRTKNAFHKGTEISS